MSGRVSVVIQLVSRCEQILDDALQTTIARCGGQQQQETALIGGLL